MKREEHLVMLVSLINAKHQDILVFFFFKKIQLFLLNKIESGLFLGFACIEREKRGQIGPSILLKLLFPL